MTQSQEQALSRLMKNEIYKDMFDILKEYDEGIGTFEDFAEAQAQTPAQSDDATSIFVECVGAITEKLVYATKEFPYTP